MMNYFPSNKAMLITFFVLISWFGFKFVNSANDNFFQLNYSWENERIIEDFGAVSIDSVNYNFIVISFKNNKPVSPSITYKLSNTNNSYYFRYTYTIIENNVYEFYGVEWITEIPIKDNSSYEFSGVDIPLNQKEGASTITLGDKFLIENEAKYFRKFLAKRGGLKFYGNYHDVFSFPHEVIKNNTSASILKQIDEIENTDNYILFFGAGDNKLNTLEVKNNLKGIINKLNVNKNPKKIIWILLPPSPIKETDNFNSNYNMLIKEVATTPNSTVIDSYSLFKDDLQKYIRKDGFSLSKEAYYLLAKKVSEKLSNE